MAKYLSLSGLETVWGKIKGTFLDLSGTGTMTAPIKFGNYRYWAVPASGAGLSIMSSYGQAPLDEGVVPGGSNYAVGLNIGGYGYHMGIGWNVSTKKFYVRGSGSDGWKEVALGNLGNYLPLSGGTMSNTNKVTNLNADLLDGYDSSKFLVRIAYNFGNGCLITSDFAAAGSNMCYVEITGNSYGSGGDKTPFMILLNFYDYTSSGGIIGSPKAISLGNNSIEEIKLFRYNEKVCIWFYRTGSYQTFYVRWYTQSSNGHTNHAASVTNSAMPDSSEITNLVTVVPIKNITETNEMTTTEINNICV